MPSRTLKTPKTKGVNDSVLDALSDMFSNVGTTENQTNTDKKRRISERGLKGISEPDRFKPENPQKVKRVKKPKKTNGNPSASSSRTSLRVARSAIQATRLSPQEDRPTSPQAARTSPRSARTSPQAATTSPQVARTSPRGNSRRFVQVRRTAATQAQGAALISEMRRMQLEIRSLTNRINDLQLKGPVAKRLLNKNAMTPSGLYTRINADMREAPPIKLPRRDE